MHEKKPAHFAARFSGQLQMSASCGLDIWLKHPRLKLMENGVLVTYSTSESAAKDGGNMEGGQVTTKSMDGTALK